MSSLISLQLECDAVHVVSRDGSARALSWSPDAPDAMVDAVRAVVGTPTGVVIVVGLGLLEIAQPELPPLSPAVRRAMLWRDGDRYFPLDEPIAVASADEFAFAMSARRLASWVRAISVLAPIRAVVTAAQVAALHIGSGAGRVSAAPGERGLVRAHDGQLVSVRRMSGVDAPVVDAARNRASEASEPLLSPADLGRAALAWRDAPLDRQLLDASLERTLGSARTRRALVSVLLTAAAVMLLAWSADHWRESLAAATANRVESLRTRAEPAERAADRVARARAELSLLAEAESRRRAPDAPLAVLAELSRVLPRDAFVQRLEWDGQAWRVDGTADHAPALVPLLDSNAQFRDVRIAASSQRFLDAGRQRESFAISFRTKSVQRGAHGAP